MQGMEILQRRLGLLGVLVTLVVSPFWSLDPINLPKFFLLVAGAGLMIGGSLSGVKTQWETLKIPFAFVLFFVTSLIWVLVFSGAPLLGQIFGTYGRNTGLLNYLALSGLLLTAIVISNVSIVRNIINYFLIASLINLMYSIFQATGNDPIEWSGSNERIFGTLGNPNFLSALLGMSASMGICILIFFKTFWNVRVFVVTFVSASTFIIWKSNSIQGIGILGISCMLIVLMWMKKANYSPRLVFATSFVFFVSGLVSVLGMLQKGPLQNLLYQPSITYRGDYWRAGINMFLDQKLVGVGLDNYGNWYRQFRSQGAAFRRGPDVTSNSAHNVFIDMFANGGILLGSSYLLLTAYTLRRSWLLLKISNFSDPWVNAIVIAWIGFTIQSVISINQIGLTVWGWIFQGVIIGLSLKIKSAASSKYNYHHKKAQKRELISAGSLLLSTLLFLIACIFAVWPLRQDIEFRSALEKGDAIAIQDVVRKFPKSDYFLTYASQIFRENEEPGRALEFAKEAIQQNPRNFNAYMEIYINSETSDSEKDQMLRKLLTLDPNNKNLDGLANE